MAGHDGEALAAPFIGFTVGTALFGITLTQGYRYFLRYPRDPLLCKIKVMAVCVLDLLHFVFSADMMYTFLILNFGSAEASTRNIWSLKALGTTQAVLIILVQIIYLRRIQTLSSIPAFHSDTFIRSMQATLWVVGLIAVGFGVGFCYELQRLDAILSFVGNSEWIIYMGFGATTAIDIVITAMMCLVLYQTRMDIGGGYISRRGDRLFRSLATYVVATGIVTSSVSLLVIILYVARPNSLFYIAVTFSAPRLYTNSVFVMLDNFRRHPSVDVVDDLEDFEATSRVVFGGLTPVSPMRARATRSKTTNIDTSLEKGTSRGQRLGLTAGGLDSESSDGDVEAQDKGFLLSKEDVGPYSPYYSPLEARKKVNVMFGMQEPEEIGGGSWIDFWKVQRRLWLSWPVDRRSSL